MTIRSVGFGLTVGAVLILLASAILGLDVDAGQGSGLEDSRIAYSRPAAVEGIRVEVLNASGITGLARQVTEQLRSRGFDVVYYGNAGRLARDSTTILDRAGNPDAIHALSQALGVDRIETAVDTSLYLEATVVLGGDWRR